MRLTVGQPVTPVTPRNRDDSLSRRNRRDNHLVVDLWRPEPLFEQLAAILRAKIESGEWPAGSKIPAELALQQTYDVGRGTVRKALAMLREEGHIVTFDGRGSFVPPSED